jgi:hypothetical protein
VERGGKARRLQGELSVQIELQRQAQKIGFGIAADLFDQVQCPVIASQQQVLAIATPRARPPS